MTDQGHPMTAPDIITRMQCITCRRRLAHERAQDGSDPQVCVECRETSVTRDWAGPGIPLAVDIDEAVALALSVVELNSHEKPGEGHIATDLARALLALHASRDAEAKVVERYRSALIRTLTRHRASPHCAHSSCLASIDAPLLRMKVEWQPDEHGDWWCPKHSSAVDDLIRLRAGKERP